MLSQTGLLHQIGDYRIEGPLGEGGVAVVYKASPLTAPASGRAGDLPDVVALKVLKPDATKQPNVLACFQFESRVLKRLRHPGILRVFDAGVDDGRLYTAMELIDGPSLGHFLLAKKRLTETAAVDIVTQIAEALAYLHGLGYVHRDIKPANIMLGRDGRAVLFDFGTVIKVSDGAGYEVGLYGTPAFLAPEQIRLGGLGGDAGTGEEAPTTVDGRADLYALGMILYLMVAGRKPYYGGRNEVLRAQLEQVPPPPSEFARVSPDLEAIILRALAKDPADRFQSGAEFADALRRAELLSMTVRPSLGQRLFGWLRSDN
jgi:serine/threonine protein kinase